MDLAGSGVTLTWLFRISPLDAVSESVNLTVRALTACGSRLAQWSLSPAAFRVEDPRAAKRRGVACQAVRGPVRECPIPATITGYRHRGETARHQRIIAPPATGGEARASDGTPAWSSRRRGGRPGAQEVGLRDGHTARWGPLPIVAGVPAPDVPGAHVPVTLPTGDCYGPS